MFSSPWHLLLFDRLRVTIIGTLTIIGGKAVCVDGNDLRKNMLIFIRVYTSYLAQFGHMTGQVQFLLVHMFKTLKTIKPGKK